MSDININGIPNMGFAGGGGGIIGGSASGGIPAMSADQINSSMWGRFTPGAGQAALNNNFANFGVQPAYYAALGAAYGRNTGGFGGGRGGFDPNIYAPRGDVERGDDLAPITGDGGSDGMDPGMGSPFAEGGMYAPSPRYSGGGIGSDASAGRDAIARLMAGYGSMYRQPSANPDYFNPGTYAGDQGNFGLQYNGKAQPGDIGFSRQPSYPNLGYNPGMQNWFANPGMNANAFQNRFGMGFPNAGTPSQYAPGADMPSGFSPSFDADNPGGALPLRGPTSVDFGNIPGG
jgi:hypothetical protein